MDNENRFPRTNCCSPINVGWRIQLAHGWHRKMGFQEFEQSDPNILKFYLTKKCKSDMGHDYDGQIIIEVDPETGEQTKIYDPPPYYVDICDDPNTIVTVSPTRKECRGSNGSLGSYEQLSNEHTIDSVVSIAHDKLKEAEDELGDIEEPSDYSYIINGLSSAKISQDEVEYRVQSCRFQAVVPKPDDWQFDDGGVVITYHIRTITKNYNYDDKIWEITSDEISEVITETITFNEYEPYGFGSKRVLGPPTVHGAGQSITMHLTSPPLKPRVEWLVTIRGGCLRKKGMISYSSNGGPAQFYKKINVTRYTDANVFSDGNPSSSSYSTYYRRYFEQYDDPAGTYEESDRDNNNAYIFAHLDSSTAPENVIDSINYWQGVKYKVATLSNTVREFLYERKINNGTTLRDFARVELSDLYSTAELKSVVQAEYNGSFDDPQESMIPIFGGALAIEFLSEGEDFYVKQKARFTFSVLTGRRVEEDKDIQIPVTIETFNLSTGEITTSTQNLTFHVKKRERYAYNTLELLAEPGISKRAYIRQDDIPVLDWNYSYGEIQAEWINEPSWQFDLDSN